MKFNENKKKLVLQTSAIASATYDVDRRCVQCTFQSWSILTKRSHSYRQIYLILRILCEFILRFI